jgi:hypothetical protein
MTDRKDLLNKVLKGTPDEYLEALDEVSQMFEDGSAFRKLSAEEAEISRQWARKNYTPGQEINSLWHPVIRTECQRMNREAGL